MMPESAGKALTSQIWNNQLEHQSNDSNRL